MDRFKDSGDFTEGRREYAMVEQESTDAFASNNPPSVFAFPEQKKGHTFSILRLHHHNQIKV